MKGWRLWNERRHTSERESNGGERVRGKKGGKGIEEDIGAREKMRETMMMKVKEAMREEKGIIEGDIERKGLKE